MSDEPTEPLKLPNTADGLLKRIAGSSKSTPSVGTIPKEKQEQYGKWWEMRLLGTSITEIVKHEERNGNSITERQVRHGLDRYADICMDEPGRNRRMAQHKGFVDKLRQVCMGQVQNLRKQVLDADGKGLPVHSQETTYDQQGNAVASKKKVTYEAPDRLLVSWLRFAVELDKYGATIDGLMSDLGAEDSVNVIDVNMEGFIGFGEDTDDSQSSGAA